jgi:hypothetical protein
LLQQRVKLDAAMVWRVRREAPDRLCELPLHADLPAAACLVPGDSNVNESLQEVSFCARRGSPGILELFVRGEVLAGTDQLDARFKA